MATAPVPDPSSSSTAPALRTWVIYRLTADDVSAIITRRLAGSAFGAGFAGRDPIEGEQLPALVVRSTPPSESAAGEVDLQVFCAGNDTVWVSDVKPGTDPGQYEA